VKPNEAAFEEYVATWLVEHVGYDHLKGPGQARPPAFDPVTGIDAEDLFEFIGSDPGQRVGAAQAAPRWAAGRAVEVRRTAGGGDRQGGARSTCCVTVWSITA